MPQRVLILGGAGFLGSHLVHRFAEAGWSVAVIDGLLARTGGDASNLAQLPGIEFVAQPLAQVEDLPARLDRADIAIDAMAWTAHLMALRDPRYDLQLNVESHLTLIEALRTSTLRRVIYLGSRGQYGNTAIDPLVETSPMEPNDIQGIHKLAAESYFRVLAPLCKLDVLSLRLPNCFGERQPTTGEDLGLIGGFIRDALQDKTIEVYGRSRGRSILYAKDFAEIVFRLAELRSWSGFVPVNIAGQYLSIAELAESIVRLAARGRLAVKENLPQEIKAIDAGSARLDTSKLNELLGKIFHTPLETALARTIRWVQANPL